VNLTGTTRDTIIFQDMMENFKAEKFEIILPFAVHDATNFA